MEILNAEKLAIGSRKAKCWEEPWKRSKYPPDDGQVRGQNEKLLDSGVFLGDQREHKTDQCCHVVEP